MALATRDDVGVRYVHEIKDWRQCTLDENLFVATLIVSWWFGITSKRARIQDIEDELEAGFITEGHDLGN